MAAGIARDRCLEGAEVELALALGLLQGSGEFPAPLDLGEGETRRGDGGHRDGVNDGPVAPVRVSNEVGVDPGEVVTRDGGDVDQAAPDLLKVVEGGGVAMAEQRAGPAGEDRRHPAAVEGRLVWPTA